MERALWGWWLGTMGGHNLRGDDGDEITKWGLKAPLVCSNWKDVVNRVLYYTFMGPARKI